MELKTPLYDVHVKAGGKIVPFAGYLLPVQYETGVIKEHMAVRTQAGLFDVSHMGEILCEGKDSLVNLQHILTNDFTNMVDGQARYSPMCNENGGTVDDLIVYKRSDGHYFIVVNAANKDKDYQWMLAVRRGYIYRCIRPVWTDRSSGTEGDGNLKKTYNRRKYSKEILSCSIWRRSCRNALHRIQDRIYR